MMKVALVSTYFPQQCGIATYTEYLANALYKLSLTEYPGLSVKILGEKGAKPVKKDKFEVLAAYHRDEDFGAQLRQHVTDVDVLHIQHEYGLFHLDDRLVKFLNTLDSAIKRVITWHAIIPEQFSKRTPNNIEEEYVKNVCGYVDEVIVHRASHKAIIERLGIPSEKIHVIAHGTALCDIEKEDARNKLGLPVDKNIVCMMGFIKRHKRYHIAVETIAEIVKEHPDFILHLAGGLAPDPQDTDVKYIREIQDRIEELNLQNHVIFSNKFYPNEEMPYLLSSADVILLPYLEETRAASGLLHLAAGAGVPVVASRIAKFEELQEICEELLCLTPETMAKTALRLCQDPNFRNYAQSKIEKFAQKTSWKKVSRQHVDDVYKR